MAQMPYFTEDHFSGGRPVAVSDTPTVMLSPTNNPIPATTPKDALIILASGIDEAGNAHGNYYDNNLGVHGYVVSNGLFQTIDVPFASADAGKGTTVAAVTADGVIWGAYKDGSGTSHGFVKYLSQYYQVDAPSGTYGTWLTAGNATQAAGTYVDAKGISHGYIQTFSSSGPQLTTVDDPAGAKGTWLTGLSNNGQATGFYLDAGGSYHGFAYQAGQYLHIDAPSAIATIPEGVNSSGQIVGAYQDVKGWHGFIYANGTFTPYDHANASLTAMTGINDHGDVVGIATVGTNSISFSTHLLG